MYILYDYLYKTFTQLFLSTPYRGGPPETLIYLGVDEPYLQDEVLEVPQNVQK